MDFEPTYVRVTIGMHLPLEPNIPLLVLEAVYLVVCGPSVNEL